MIIRSDHKKDFSVIDNGYLRDKRLSLKAKGLLTVMLSLKPDWKYTVEGLAHICKDGGGAISTALDELEKYGYFDRCEQSRNAQGRLGSSNWIIREVPEKDEVPMCNNPATDNPKAVEPAAEKAIQLNTYSSTTNKLKTDISSPTPIEERKRSKSNTHSNGKSSKESNLTSITQEEQIIDMLSKYSIGADRTDIIGLCTDVGVDTVLESIHYAVERGAAHWGYVAKVARTGGPKRGTRTRHPKRPAVGQNAAGENTITAELIALQTSWQQEAEDVQKELGSGKDQGLA